MLENIAEAEREHEERCIIWHQFANYLVSVSLLNQSNKKGRLLKIKMAQRYSALFNWTTLLLDLSSKSRMWAYDVLRTWEQ